MDAMGSGHRCVEDMETSVVYRSGHDILMRYFERREEMGFKNLGMLKTQFGDFQATYERPNMYITYVMKNNPNLFKKVTDTLNMKRHYLDNIQNLQLGIKTYDMRNKNTVGNIGKFFSKVSEIKLTE